MVKAKYIETVPRKHTKFFEVKSDAWSYWQKRYEKYSDWSNWGKPDFNYKDSFDATIITLNKDGQPRKLSETKPLTQKQKDAHKRAMILLQKQTAERKILRGEVEEKLNKHLRELGFTGKVYVKFFKEIVNGNS